MLFILFYLFHIQCVYVCVQGCVCVCDILLCVYMILGRVHSMNMEVKGKV